MLEPQGIAFVDDLQSPTDSLLEELGEGYDAAAEELMWEAELAALQAGWQAEQDARLPHRLSEGALLDEYATAERTEVRARARRLALLAEIEQRDLPGPLLGLTASGWLVNNATHSPRQAKREVRLASQIAAVPQLAAAMAGGRLSSEQAERLAHGLGRLPEELDATQRDAVAAQLVEFATSGEHGPDALSRLVNRAIEIVAPEVAEEADRLAVERTDRDQQRDRYVATGRDLDGSWLIHAKLPVIEGTQIVTALNAIATRQRGNDALTGEETTWGQAMADALVSVFNHHASCGEAPQHGADRPRVTVTVTLDTLKGALAAATLIDTDTPITAQQARLMACDADILPMVMGGDSRPLDVGREKRLFTGAIRQAIILRDRGCVFPGCDRPPSRASAITGSRGGRGDEPRSTTARCCASTTTTSPSPTRTRRRGHSGNCSSTDAACPLSSNRSTRAIPAAHNASGSTTASRRMTPRPRAIPVRLTDSLGARPPTEVPRTDGAVHLGLARAGRRGNRRSAGRRDRLAGHRAAGPWPVPGRLHLS